MMEVMVLEKQQCRWRGQDTRNVSRYLKVCHVRKRQTWLKCGQEKKERKKEWKRQTFSGWLQRGTRISEWKFWEIEDNKENPSWGIRAHTVFLKFSLFMFSFAVLGSGMQRTWDIQRLRRPLTELIKCGRDWGCLFNIYFPLLLYWQNSAFLMGCNVSSWSITLPNLSCS